MLFVIGAGASKEVLLPTGNELKKDIAERLDIRFKRPTGKISGDDCIYDAFCLHARTIANDPGNTKPYIHTGWHIRDAMPQAHSIDNFIDQHSGDSMIELCGKLAIVRSILSAEKDSLLYYDTRDGFEKLDFSVIEQKWYNKFWQLLTQNCRKEDLATCFRKVSIIIFNYDRCVEHYLYHSLQNYYKFSPDESAKLVKTIDIFHPYGKVGYLPWQKIEKSINYGAEPHPQQLLDLVNQLKTFSEGIDPNSSNITAIRQKMLDARKVIFLGFAFHPLNMKLMAVDTQRRPKVNGANYFATAYDISSSDCEIIKKYITELCNGKENNIHLQNKTCVALFNEYQRSISL